VSADILPAVELEPRQEPAGSVLWLHGLGADGHDFEAIVPELHIPAGRAPRFVFPHAPVRPVTINGGYRMRAWYDILGFDDGARQDEAGIAESQRAVERLIARERDRGIASDRIVLAGFSQGGAVALHTALRQPEPLAGVLALSTYLPLSHRLREEAHPANARTPIFMAHGTHDPVVPLSLGASSRDALVSLGYDVDWRTYPMAHQVSAQEIADVREWLLRVLPEPPR
jgi:phospholipase/carboxylesterase